MIVFIKRLAALAVILALLAAGAAWYVRPAKPLDLSYVQPDLRGKLTAMLSTRRPEMVLTGREVNDLLKQALSARPELHPGVLVTGAAFALQDERLSADVNLLVRQRLEAGARLWFKLSWTEPYLTAVHTGTEIRGISVPLEWFRLDPLQLDLNADLPKQLRIREVAFEGSTVRLSFNIR
ncbi:hypothetical protein [Paenibacillus naphthalenovorans]|uniref:hypothetical protein n=1 Tax=Paenibacillus naphthalenovorans TaxID=162209 RepID=UPI003D29F8F2